MRWILVLAVVAAGVTVGSLFWRDHSREQGLRDDAEGMLTNFHPDWIPKIKRDLVRRARERGITLSEDRIWIERRETDRKSAMAAVAARMKLPVAVANLEVAIALEYQSSVLGIRRRHRLRVSRVVGVQPTAPDPTAQQRGAGHPLPKFVEE